MKILECDRRLTQRRCRMVFCLMLSVGRHMGEGHCPFPVLLGVAPVLAVEGPQSVSLQVAVVRVGGTLAGDTSGRKCPRDEQDWRPPSGVYMMNGGAGSLSGGGGGRLWPPRMLLEVSFRGCLPGALPWLMP